MDSGEVFVPDESLFPIFLTGLPQLHTDQRSFLEAPFSYEELATAVDKAANGKAPGLDGLSYEFYRLLFPWLALLCWLASMGCWRLGN